MAVPYGPAHPLSRCASRPPRPPPTRCRQSTPCQRRLARAWLWLGLAALVGSGLFSVLLVLARTPGINAWLPAGDFFRVALVVHVDLSVLVWFTAIAGLLWSLNLRGPATPRRSVMDLLTLGLCALGAAGHGVRRLRRPRHSRDGQLHTDAGQCHLPRRGGRVRRRRAVAGAAQSGAGTARWPGGGRRRRAALRPARQRRGHRRGTAGVRLVARGGADRAAGRGLLRDPVLGRWPRAAVHVDAADAGSLAGAGAGLRRSRPLEPARRRADVRVGAGERLRHTARLPDARRRHGRAPRHAHVGHALRRRFGHRAGRAGRAAGGRAAASTEPGTAAAARGAAAHRCCCSLPAA